MRQQATMKVQGFLSRDPQLAQTRDGDSVLGLSVPFTPRRLNRQTNEWEDAGPTLWVEAALWREEAELYASKLAKGTAVIVEGVPALRTWEKDGRSGATLEIRFAQVSIVPTRPRQQQAGPPADDPADAWATPGWPAPGELI